MPTTLDAHRKHVAELIGTGKISNSTQLDVVVDYLKKVVVNGGQLDLNDFNEKCGIGKQLTREQVAEVVSKVFNENK